MGSSWDQIASAILTHTTAITSTLPPWPSWPAANSPLLPRGASPPTGAKSGVPPPRGAGLLRHYDEQPFLTPMGLRIEPLELRHDGGPTYGFRIEAKPARRGRAIAIGYMADTGSWTEAMADALAEVDFLGVEFNHDVEMQALASVTGS